MYAERSAMTTLPLTGYRVLELAHLIAGPACGMYLADMGADVIKVESREAPDASRSVYGITRAGEGILHLPVNRNKRALCLDLQKPAGRETFYRMVKTADVVLGFDNLKDYLAGPTAPPEGLFLMRVTYEPLAVSR